MDKSSYSSIIFIVLLNGWGIMEGHDSLFDFSGLKNQITNHIVSILINILSLGLGLLSIVKNVNDWIIPLLIIFIVFLVLNIIFFIQHGYYIYKYKASNEHYKLKSLTYLNYHRNGFKNIVEANQAKDKLIFILKSRIDDNCTNLNEFFNEHLLCKKDLIDQYNKITTQQKKEFEDDNQDFVIYYHLYKELEENAYKNYISIIKDIYNRFISSILIKVQSETEHYLSEKGQSLNVSVTLKLFSNPCDNNEINNTESNLFVYTSFRDKTTYRNTKRREIGQAKYHIDNQIDFREALKGPNYRYIYNNIENEETSIVSAYCFTYYNSGATVSIRIANRTDAQTINNDFRFYGFLCCDVLNSNSSIVPIDSHIANILDIYGHIISDFFYNIESYCNEIKFSEVNIFDILYELAKNSKGYEM